MAKVKPYIITVKYIATYSDPAPTEEQILAELNVDAIELSIEEAVVTKSPKWGIAVDLNTPPAPAVPVEDTVVQESVPAPASKKRRPIEYGFDTKHLELKGPSVAILHTLQTLGPKTLSQVREITNRYDSAMQVSMSRLKAQGRVRMVGKDGNNKSIYAFVK